LERKFRGRGYHSGEFNLSDKYRRDGVEGNVGVYVSAYDYLREDLKSALIDYYTKQVIEPHIAKGEKSPGITPWEPNLTNYLLIHKKHRGTLVGEWYLVSRAWAVDDVPDVLTLLPPHPVYYPKQRIVAGEDASGGGATWEADPASKYFVFRTDIGTREGTFTLDESGPLIPPTAGRAKLTLEYTNGAKDIYIERTAIQRRLDGGELGTREKP